MATVRATPSKKPRRMPDAVPGAGQYGGGTPELAPNALSNFLRLASGFPLADGRVIDPSQIENFARSTTQLTLGDAIKPLMGGSNMSPPPPPPSNESQQFTNRKELEQTSEGYIKYPSGDFVQWGKGKPKKETK